MGLKVEREISALLHGFISHEKLIGLIGESERWITLRVDTERHVESVGMDSQVCPYQSMSTTHRGFGSTNPTLALESKEKIMGM